MSKVTWTRIASGEFTNGRFFVWRDYVALTAATWWHVGTRLHGDSLRAFTRLKNAKAFADLLPKGTTV